MLQIGISRAANYPHHPNEASQWTKKNERLSGNNCTSGV